MLKMLIEFDREKIFREQLYIFEELEKNIEEMFASKNVYRDEDGLFVTEDLSIMGTAFHSLLKQQWFTNNLKRWIWYDSGNGSEFEEIDLTVYCYKGEHPALHQMLQDAQDGRFSAIYTIARFDTE